MKLPFDMAKSMAGSYVKVNDKNPYLTQLAGPEPKGTLATARVSGTCYRNFEIRWRPVLPRLGFGGLKVP